MENLTGTRTEANLMAAFAGESQAKVKYKLFSRKASEDGFEEIAEVFKKTAKNEKAHAEIWFKYLNGGTLAFTKENLDSAAGGEHFEWSDMYLRFSKEAEDEGFKTIAQQFKMVAEIEKEHEKKYLELRQTIEDNSVFEKPIEQTWICQNCGHRHFGKNAPEKCPVCSKEKAYLKIYTQ